MEGGGGGARSECPQFNKGRVDRVDKAIRHAARSY